MKDERRPLSMERKKNVYERHIGKYVIISFPTGNSVYGGVLDEIEDNCAILNPHQEVNFLKIEETIKPKYDFIYTDMIVPLTGAVMRPTTLESLLNFCKRENYHIKNDLPNNPTDKKSE